MALTFTVRAARPTDAAAVDRLLERCYGTLLAPDYEPEVLARALPRMNRSNPKLLVCPTWYVAQIQGGEHDGRIGGCGGWTPERPGSAELEPGLAHVRHFGTDPDLTGHGIARALIERTIADAQEAGFDRLECFSTITAEAFYSRFGFRTVERVDVAMGPDISLPSVLMIRP